MSFTASAFITLILAIIAGSTLNSAARTILGADNSTQRLFATFLLGYAAQPILSLVVPLLTATTGADSMFILGAVPLLAVMVNLLRLAWMVLTVRFVALYGDREMLRPWYPAVTLSLCALGIALVLELPIQLLVTNLMRVS